MTWEIRALGPERGRMTWGSQQPLPLQAGPSCKQNKKSFWKLFSNSQERKLECSCLNVKWLFYFWLFEAFVHIKLTMFIVTVWQVWESSNVSAGDCMIRVCHHSIDNIHPLSWHKLFINHMNHAINTHCSTHSHENTVPQYRLHHIMNYG